MPLRNSIKSFGSIAKLVHWSLSVLVIAVFSSILVKKYLLPEGDSLARYLMVNVHKPCGFLVLCVGVFGLFWSMSNPSPRLPEDMPPWKQRLAKIVHKTIYVSLILASSSGFLMSTAAGKPINLFGFLEVPLILDRNSELASVFHEAHEVLGPIVAVLLVIHLAGVFSQQFILKSPVIHRMLPRWLGGS